MTSAPPPEYDDSAPPPEYDSPPPPMYDESPPPPEYDSPPPPEYDDSPPPPEYDDSAPPPEYDSPPPPMYDESPPPPKYDDSPPPPTPTPNSTPPLLTPAPSSETPTSPSHLPLQLDSGPTPGPTPGLIAGGAAGSVVFVICTGLLVWFLLRSRRRKQKHTAATARQQAAAAMSKKDSKPLEAEFEELAGPRRFVYSELAMATNFFSEEKKLGEGGFGSVYHGYLKDMNLHVAVKRVAQGSQHGKKEYVSEVRTISQLRHRNLVQLIGWCHDDNELLLVYQLMPNGSLDTHIHNQSKVLPWQLRHEIVLGIGSAILYLHEEWEQCVLHRDIKPSNLMLDAFYNVKLGDFGLARLVEHGKGSHTTTMRAGTMGYMDPESMVNGRASKESDVYSFGVVVLEIVSGKRPLLVKQGKEAFTMQLVELIWNLYNNGRILDAADPRLNGEFDRQKMERLMVAALWCVHPDRSQRPSISQAVNVMRFEAPLPIIRAKMPVATYALPIDSLFVQSLGATTSSTDTSSGMGTTTYSNSSATGNIFLS